MYRPRTPERKIRDAVSSLIATAPFFGTLALRMQFGPGPVETLAGDGASFTFSPDWIEGATHDEIKGSVAHIVMACGLHHQFRRGARDYARWQTASRYATAPILDQANLWVPDDAKSAHAKMYANLPVEQIYDRLPDERNDSGAPSPPPPPQPGSEQGAPQPGAQGPQPGSEQGAPQPGAQGPQPESEQGAPQPESEQGAPQGDGSTSPPQGDGSPSPMPGEVQDAPGDAKARDAQEAQWDLATKQAIRSAKRIGSEPGRAEEIFEGQHVSRRDWRETLREFMRASAPTDYSWARPSRRFLAGGLYLPSLHGEGMGPIVIGIDTSGSVDDDAINHNVSDVLAIAEELRPDRVWIIQCDSRVTDVQDFDAHDAPDEIVIRGRGGTRFQPLFDEIENLEIDPDVLVYFTDLMGAPPENEPPYPTIWAVESADQANDIPFGSAVVIGEGD